MGLALVVVTLSVPFRLTEDNRYEILPQMSTHVVGLRFGLEQLIALNKLADGEGIPLATMLARDIVKKYGLPGKVDGRSKRSTDEWRKMN